MGIDTWVAYIIVRCEFQVDSNHGRPDERTGYRRNREYSQVKWFVTSVRIIYINRMQVDHTLSFTIPAVANCHEFSDLLVDIDLLWKCSVKRFLVLLGKTLSFFSPPELSPTLPEKIILCEDRHFCIIPSFASIKRFLTVSRWFCERY